jgi:1,4-dihydroxy-2-naphthoate octaprenyltransferase
MTIYKSTIQLLRIPFSINLLPIFLFAVYSSLGNLHAFKTLGVFVLIHFVFYPASNAYNSYMDADTSSIAGIKEPPAPTKQLFYASLLLDFIGLSCSLLISIPFFIINVFLMLLSRAYSYRGIRLKRYGVWAFIMVALAQGGLSFFNMYLGIQGFESFPDLNGDMILRVFIASLFVGAIYPITQIYQHEEDEANGDKTISMVLGIKGTLVFSGFVFLVSNALLYLVLTLGEFLVFEACMLFPIAFFLRWCYIVWQDVGNANFQNTMIMALTASIAMIVGFGIILMGYF